MAFEKNSELDPKGYVLLRLALTETEKKKG